jgi:hypothetical protein
VIYHFVIHICDWVNLLKDEMVRGRGGWQEGGVREGGCERQRGRKREERRDAEGLRCMNRDVHAKRD